MAKIYWPGVGWVGWVGGSHSDYIANLRVSGPFFDGIW